MDNIGDYLIVLFFVLSFLSSVLKKKKKQGNSNNSGEHIGEVPLQKRVPNKPIVQKKQNALENFFNALNEEQKAETKPASEVDIFFENAFKNSESDNNNLPKPTNNSYEHEVNKHVTPKKDEIEKPLSAPAKRTEYAAQKTTNLFVSEIRETLIKKDSIKKYIIVNEILGKPKALQR